MLQNGYLEPALSTPKAHVRMLGVPEPQKGRRRLIVHPATVNKLCYKLLIPQGSKVRVWVDNTTVIHTLGNRRSKSFILNQLVGRILRHVVVVQVQYIRSEDNPADILSRSFETTKGNLASAN